MFDPEPRLAGADPRCLTLIPAGIDFDLRELAPSSAERRSPTKGSTMNAGDRILNNWARLLDAWSEFALRCHGLLSGNRG